MAIKTGVNTDWLDTSKAMPIARDGHVKRKFLDVPYGPEPLQKMDILLPDEGDGPFPLIMDVHGGGMVSGDKHDFHMYPMFYALQRGFAAACINYRLSPAVKYPVQLHDMKRAILFLYEHAAEYKIDRENFFLWGTSAGGNLVLMGGLKQGPELPEALKAADRVPIRAVAALCPEVDMSRLGKGFTLTQKILMRLATLGYFEKVLGIRKPTPEDIARTNPMTYIHRGLAPLYLQHGDRDPGVPVEQSLEYAEAARKLLPAEDLIMDVIRGAAHAGDGPEFLKEEHVAPILEFFRAHIV